jgi:glycogen debranching enzyme
MAQAAWQAVTQDLWTPLGLRTLAPQAPDYQDSYNGDQVQRDRAYHQGSVWPSLTGIYADATLATCGRAALGEHVAPILARIGEHLTNEGCIGHVSELFNGSAPHRAGGAPASLASVAELYRSQRLLEDSALRPASSDSELRPRVDSASAPKRVAHSNQHGRETLSK